MAEDKTEETIASVQINSIVGTVEDDVINTGSLVDPETEVDKINGNAGDDVITTGAASDLAAGDMVGNEWTFVDGKWTYDPSRISNEGSATLPSYDDVIETGDGDDVLLGNGGNDQLAITTELNLAW